MSEYRFGASAFLSELWIANKRVFSKPISVDVELTNAGDFDWIIADATGKEVRSVKHQVTGGWTSIDLASLGLFDDYSIGFRNTGARVREIKQGIVYLK